MIACQHDDLDARLPAPCDGFGYIPPRRVFQSDEAKKGHVPFECRSIRLGGETLHRIGEDALATARHRLLRGGDLRARRPIEWSCGCRPGYALKARAPFREPPCNKELSRTPFRRSPRAA